ncbi:hypothetical protein CR513_27442, partial [Mucuna pruriens]
MKRAKPEQGTCGSLWSSINNQIFWFLFHMTQAMFSDIAEDKYSSSKTPRHLPTLFVKGTLPTCPIHIPILFFYSLHQTRSCKPIFHLFQIISNPHLSTSSFYI